MTKSYRFGDALRREQIRTLDVDDFSDTDTCSKCGFSCYGDIPHECPQCGNAILTAPMFARGTGRVVTINDQEIRDWWAEQVAKEATLVPYPENDDKGND